MLGLGEFNNSRTGCSGRNPKSFEGARTRSGQEQCLPGHWVFGSASGPLGFGPGPPVSLIVFKLLPGYGRKSAGVPHEIRVTTVFFFSRIARNKPTWKNKKLIMFSFASTVFFFFDFFSLLFYCVFYDPATVHRRAHGPKGGAVTIIPMPSLAYI